MINGNEESGIEMNNEEIAKALDEVADELLVINQTNMTLGALRKKLNDMRLRLVNKVNAIRLNDNKMKPAKKDRKTYSFNRSELKNSIINTMDMLDAVHNCLLDQINSITQKEDI